MVATVQTKKNICVTVTLVILITYMEMKMSSTVVIYLDFERDDIDDIDVYEYLNELMDNNDLDWEIGTTCQII